MSFRVLRSIVIFGIGCATVFACYMSWDVVRQARALFHHRSSFASADFPGSANLPTDPFAAAPSNASSTSSTSSLGVIQASGSEACDSYSSVEYATPCTHTDLAELPAFEATSNEQELSEIPPELLEAPAVLPDLPVCELPRTSGLDTQVDPACPCDNPKATSSQTIVSPASEISSPVTEPHTAEAGAPQIRANPIECAIVDRDSGTVVASFRISEASDVIPASPAHIPEVASTVERSTAKHGGPYAPYLDLRIDLNTGHTLIDARNLPLDSLVSEMNQRYHFPIACDIDIEESVSARIEARDPVTALRHIVESSGYAVLALPDQTWHVVRAVATRDPQRSPPGRTIALASTHSQAQTEVTPAASPAARAVPVRRIPMERVASEECSSDDAMAIMHCQQLIDSGRSDLALDGLGELFANSPNCAPAARLLAGCYIARDDMESALTAATEAIRLNRHSVEANQIMGRILQELGQDERSRHYLDQAEYLRAEKEAQ